jgi:hypothetical protein
MTLVESEIEHWHAIEISLRSLAADTTMEKTEL